MTPRSRGDYFERQTKAALQEAGWSLVRSAGSLGPADLVAIRRNAQGGAHVLLISCKLDGRCGPAERDALRLAADQASAEPLVASRPKAGRVLLTSLEGHRVRGELKVPSVPRHRKDDDDDGEA
jgi:Holliday junction resolvase